MSPGGLAHALQLPPVAWQRTGSPAPATSHTAHGDDPGRQMAGHVLTGEAEAQEGKVVKYTVMGGGPAVGGEHTVGHG